MLRKIVLLTVFCFLNLTAHAAPETVSADKPFIVVQNGHISVQIEDQPLAQVMTAIAEQAGITIDFYDVAAMERRVSARFRDEPLEEGLRRILRENYVFSFARLQDGGTRLTQVRVGDRSMRANAVRISGKSRTNHFRYGNDATSIGSVREGEGAHIGPGSFAADDQGRLYVLDTVNNRVQVYAPDGKHLRSIELKGEMPEDLTLRADGSLTVYDLNGNIYQYGANGEALAELPMDETQWHTRGPMHWVGDQLYVRVNGVGDRLVAVLENGRLAEVPVPLRPNSEVVQPGTVGETTGRRYAAVLHEEQRGAEIRVSGRAESATLFIPLQDIVSVEVLGEDKHGNVYVKTEADKDNQIQVEVSRFDRKGEYHGTLPIPGNDYEFWSTRTLTVTQEGVIHQFMPGEEQAVHATYQFN
jgi:hypothetical protein